MTTPEKKVKQKVAKMLKEMGAYYFYPATGGYGRSGVPDIIGCYAGNFFGIECKAGGTICDNSDAWRHLSDAHGSPHVNYVGLVHQRLGRTINGYTPLELLKIEAVFLAACGYGVPLSRDSVRPVDPSNKDILFKGLCAVVAHLCLLDGVKDVMDYSQLFQYTPRRTSCNNEGATV